MTFNPKAGLENAKRRWPAKRAVDDEKRIWDAYTVWVQAEGKRPYIGEPRDTDAFKAGYLAAEHDAEARRLHEHGNLMP